MATTPTISANFPYASQYVDVAGEKIHYVEKGEGDPVLFLHGNPTSSYLWRNIMPYAAKTHRAIAMDLIGMGKSARPDLAYRFSDHVTFVDGFIEAMGLKNVTLVVHDWGSGLGFHYARRHAENVRGIAFMEAIMRPVGWTDFPPGYRTGFKIMRTPVLGWMMISVMNAFIEKILPSAINRTLTKEEHDYYRSAFPTIRSRRPVRQWPREIPIEGRPADVHQAVSAYNKWLTETDLPMLLCHATPGGLTTAPMVNWCRENLTNLTTADIGRGTHYVQEDNPHGIGEALETWLAGLA
ncbi:MAG: haloalkane dehalogenase [Alphaproteobacteria bacterium]|jgi:haloalkane dehalogenase|nr:haloalkane dehalogenase [Alphaproteobacteria bacterium]